MSELHDRIGNFTTIPNTVIALIPKLGPEAFTLWSYLRFRVNGQSGVAFPSYDTIRKDTSLHPRKIAAALRLLEKEQLITRRKRFGQSNVYELMAPVSSSNGGSAVLPTVEAKSFQRGQTNKTDPNKIEINKTENIYSAPPAEPAPRPKDKPRKIELPPVDEALERIYREYERQFGTCPPNISVLWQQFPGAEKAFMDSIKAMKVYVDARKERYYSVGLFETMLRGEIAKNYEVVTVEVPDGDDQRSETESAGDGRARNRSGRSAGRGLSADPAQQGARRTGPQAAQRAPHVFDTG